MISTEQKKRESIPCPICEYSDRCFPLLRLCRFMCQQGRRRKEFRQKQTTLPDGET